MAHSSSSEGSLEDLGRRLDEQLDAPASKDALLKTLKSLFQNLSQVDQSAPEETVLAMDGCKKALFRSELVEHKNKDVRLLLAACASEIMRIEAPNVPYDDHTLKVFFELVVATFAGLDDMKSPSYDKRVHILQTFYDVKSCLLMLDLAFEEGTENLIDTMFRTFFQKVKYEHPDNVFTMMLGIMVMVVNESDDEIRSTLVNEVLHNLVRRKDHISSKLAADLIRETHSSSKLGSGILLSLTTVHEAKEKEGEKEEKIGQAIRENYHNIIFKVYCCAPELLSTYIPILKEELIDNDADLRLKTVDLVGKIFTVPGHKVPKEFYELIPEFAGRFKDTNQKVRVAAMEAAKNCLLSTTVSEADLSHLTAGLENRLYDPDDTCRTRAVSLLCDAARANPKSVPKKVLEAVALRLRDNKQTVRTAAMQKLTELYSTLCSDSEVSFSADSPDWIPAKVLRSVASKMHKLQAVDIFTEQLFPQSLSVEERAKRWIAMIFHFEKTDLRVLERNLLHQKHKFQNDMRSYFHLREEVEDKKSEKFQAVITNIAASFTDAKAKEYFEKLHNMKEDGILKRLRSLLDPALPYADARKTCDDLVTSFGLKAAQLEFVKSVSLRCSHLLFGREHVVHVLKTLKALKAAENKEAILAGMTLLEEFSQYFPELMEGVEEEIVALLNEKEDNGVKEKALHILARAGSTLRDRLADSRSSLDLMLETYCLEGTRKQAKHAVTAISALSSDSGLKALSVLYGHLLNRLEKGHLPTVLQSLGCIAQIATSVFETREKDVVDFVVGDLLLREPSQTSTKTDWDSRSEECLLKIYGVKALIKSFLPSKDPHLRQSSLKNFLPTLLKLLKFGSVDDNKPTSEVDKAHLRLTAAKAVLRLSRVWEKELSVELFRHTIFTVQDPTVQVRKEFLAKAYQYLKPQQLAPKYATVYPLCATDPVKEIVDDAKRYTTDFVALRREIAQNELPSHPEYVITYLVHLLAHHPNFPEPSAEAPAYEPFYRIMFSYLQPLLVQPADGKKESVNAPAVLKILRTIKLTEDAEDPAKSQNVYVVCDLGLHIANELWNKRPAEGYKGPVRLPVSFYTDIADAAAKNDGSDLPAGLTEALNKFLSVLEPTQRKRVKKVEEASGDEAEENDDPPPKKSRKTEADKSASKSSKGRKASKEAVKEAVKEASKEVDDSATNMSEDEEAGQKRKRGRPNKEKAEKVEKAETPSEEAAGLKKRGRPKGSSAKKQKVEAESPAASADEKVETPKAKQENQKTKSVDSAKKSEKQEKELAEVASTAKRKKGSAAEKTPAKREETEDEEDEEPEPAIGRRVKVWWPKDKKYYKGEVQSYSVKTKKHRIAYDDGDKETLLMKKEKWEYLNQKEATPSPPRSGKSKKKPSASASARDDEASVQKQKSSGKKRGGERKEASDDAQHHSENHAGRPYSKVNVNGGEAESCQSKGTDTDDDEPLASYRIRRLSKKSSS